MRIFLAGDHFTGTGPANVTDHYIENLPEGPSAYIFHGCVEYENAINLEPDEKMTRVERRTLELADLIICVSETFCLWAKEFYPMYAHKITFVTNGIDEPAAAGGSKERDPHMILSVGGGMPRKKIIHICEAVDTGRIRSYPFVDDRGLVSVREAYDLYRSAALFVQNSCFETFGLAPLEALSAGCPILCSRHVGALSLIKGAGDCDVIERYDDPDEIAAKIKKILR